MDFRPVLRVHAAISYNISKYVSKAEGQSKTYQNTLQTVVGQVSDTARVAVVCQKMLSSLVGEKDISGECSIEPLLITLIAPEVCHALSQCPKWETSRQHRSLKVPEGTSDEVTFVQLPDTAPFLQR
jgi:hypothetical protein